MSIERKQKTPEKFQRIFSSDLQRLLQPLVQKLSESKKLSQDKTSSFFDNPMAPLKVIEVKKKPEAKTKKVLQPVPTRQKARSLTQLPLKP